MLLGHASAAYLGNGHVQGCSWYLWQQALAGPAQVGDAGEGREAVDGVEGTAHGCVVDVCLQGQQDQLRRCLTKAKVTDSEAHKCSNRDRRLGAESTPKPAIDSDSSSACTAILCSQFSYQETGKPACGTCNTCQTGPKCPVLCTHLKGI
jgi:hypothetical protein